MEDFQLVIHYDISCCAKISASYVNLSAATRANEKFRQKHVNVKENGRLHHCNGSSLGIWEQQIVDSNSPSHSTSVFHEMARFDLMQFWGTNVPGNRVPL